jgi:hypothetical protein
MDRSQNLGVILMAVSAVQMLVFTVGVLRRSYYAVALPVLAATGAISALLFWLGYTMVSMEPELADLDLAETDEEYSAVT